MKTIGLWKPIVSLFLILLVSGIASLLGWVGPSLAASQSASMPSISSTRDCSVKGWNNRVDCRTIVVFEQRKNTNPHDSDKLEAFIDKGIVGRIKGRVGGIEFKAWQNPSDKQEHAKSY